MIIENKSVDVNFDSKNVDPLLMLGNIYYEQGETKEAFDRYKTVMKSNKDETYCLIAMGNIIYRRAVFYRNDPEHFEEEIK